MLDSGALVLYFPAPKTATGEDILELHTHGSPAIIRAVLSSLGRCTTDSLPVRPAEPGEFTRRAFLNDRLSLPEVEALGDTLAAVTEEQRRLSVQSGSRELAARYESWRRMLVEARGELEALIDFSEDQHFDESPGELASNVATQVEALIATIEQHTQNAMRGELLRRGIAVSLIGQPNVGKSSILNGLVGRSAAIVSSEAGTTRDVVEVGLDLGGFLCRIGDTAGLRGGTASGGIHEVGEVEREGIRRAREQALQSDVVVLVLSVEPALDEQGVALQLDEQVLDTARELLAQDKRVLVAINKTDRYKLAESSATFERLAAQLGSDVARLLPGVRASDVFAVSARADEEPPRSEAGGSSETRAGAARLATLVSGLVRSFRDLTAPVVGPSVDQGGRVDGSGGSITSAGQGQHGQQPEPREDDVQESIFSRGDRTAALELGVSERQRVLLEQCAAALRRFVLQVRPHVAPGSTSEDAARPAESETTVDSTDVDIVVAAESLRAAAECLAKMTGRGEGAGDVDEVLGVVFEK